MNNIDYTTLKNLAKESGIKISDLCALSPGNDPFYTGRPAELDAARWFANLWQRYNFKPGIHLRAAHYKLVTQPEPVILPTTLSTKDKDTGEAITFSAYQNNHRCWQYLENAGKYARYLGLVDPDAFRDRRNPEAIVYAEFDNADPYPKISADADAWQIELPILPDLRDLPQELPDLPRLTADGYNVEQKYMIEVWAEKSTMNDVLLPLCRKYKTNLVTGLGELSITSVRLFLQRVRTAGKPARILYISDFDPAGKGMPVSVARKIEYFQRSNGASSYDIGLAPIVLTAEQVATYNLPRIPVKDSDKRKGIFEEAYGEGQVELDALEALYPGLLAEIVENNILQFYDPDLYRRAQIEWENLNDALTDLRQEVIARHEPELDKSRKEYAALKTDFSNVREQYKRLSADFQPKIDAYKNRLKQLKEQFVDICSTALTELENAADDINLAEFAPPEADTAENLPLLYDASRDYFNQLAAYKAQKCGVQYDGE